MKAEEAARKSLGDPQHQQNAAMVTPANEAVCDANGEEAPANWIQHGFAREIVPGLGIPLSVKELKDVAQIEQERPYAPLEADLAEHGNLCGTMRPEARPGQVRNRKWRDHNDDHPEHEK